MAASLLGNMMSEIKKISNNCTVDPIIIENTNDSNNKITVDLNVNFHVYHHYQDTNDKNLI